jgi:hypothetical protein
MENKVSEKFVAGVWGQFIKKAIGRQGSFLF